MTEIRFYHLEMTPLDKALPNLLERALSRGWRVTVEAGSPERVQALDQWLWTYEDESFLPHGSDADPDPEAHPVFLTARAGVGNGGVARFLLDGVALPPDLTGLEVVAVLFDGADEDALAAARAQWREAKATGAACAYWGQTESGRWEKRA